MNHLLQPEQRVLTHFSKKICEVGQFLGGGSQGEVYFAEREGKSIALKWYYPQFAVADQWRALEKLIKRGAPSPKFLWPLDLVSALNIHGFGYIMPLREERFKSLQDLMKKKVDPSFHILTTIGIELIDSYSQLHYEGLCYRDMNFNNVFFDPMTGEVLICDNDNVTENGDINGSILGTYGFMAPEIIRREALPSTLTDLYSLAVLLFYIFMIHHPLEGKKEADFKILGKDEMIQLYGTEPLFIFDPNDTSNYPVRGYQDNPLDLWPIYPRFLRDLFTKAFTDGIWNPAQDRVTEGEWRTAMTRLRNSIFYCSYCGKENFYDKDALRTSQDKTTCCWACKKEVSPLFHR